MRLLSEEADQIHLKLNCKLKTYVNLGFLPNQSTLKTYMTSSDLKLDWRSIAEAKKVAQYEKIPVDWRIVKTSTLYEAVDLRSYVLDTGVLSQLDIEITDISSVAELATKLTDATYTATQVVRAYCKRAAVAHQL